MSQKNFILIFVNVSYLAVHYVSFYVQISMIELWLNEFTLLPSLLNTVPLVIYFLILILSILAVRNKFTKKIHTWFFALILFSGFSLNFIFQLFDDSHYILFHSISALPIFGCIVYLALYPSKILASNQTPLIKNSKSE